VRPIKQDVNFACVVRMCF